MGVEIGFVRPLTQADYERYRFLPIRQRRNKLLHRLAQLAEYGVSQRRLMKIGGKISDLRREERHWREMCEKYAVN